MCRIEVLVPDRKVPQHYVSFIEQLQADAVREQNQLGHEFMELERRKRGLKPGLIRRALDELFELFRKVNRWSK